MGPGYWCEGCHPHSHKPSRTFDAVTLFLEENSLQREKDSGGQTLQLQFIT